MVQDGRVGGDGRRRPIEEDAMPQQHVNVDQWVEMFRAIGLEEEGMHRWHGVFEKRFPHGHQSFLEWLGLPEDRIAEIREKSVTWG
jgi:hypothetical protein